MNILFKRAIGDYNQCTLNKNNLEDDWALYNFAYHLQQAYEKIIKGYLDETVGKYPRIHDIGQLYGKAGVKDAFILLHAKSLTLWEAATRYTVIDISVHEAMDCYEYFWIAFRKYYNTTLTTKQRMTRIFSILDLRLSADDILPYMPKDVPADEFEFEQSVKEAVKLFYKDLGMS